jgi:hypothetical protein
VLCAHCAVRCAAMRARLVGRVGTQRSPNAMLGAGGRTEWEGQLWKDGRVLVGARVGHTPAHTSSRTRVYAAGISTSLSEASARSSGICGRRSSSLACGTTSTGRHAAPVTLPRRSVDSVRNACAARGSDAAARDAHPGCSWMRVGGRAAGGYRAVAGYDATAVGIVYIMSLPAIRVGHSAARLLQHTTCAARCLLARNSTGMDGWAQRHTIAVGGMGSLELLLL